MLPKIDATNIGPQTPKFIRSRISLDLCSLLGIESLACFPSMHPLHKPYPSLLNSGRPMTISLGISNALYCRCPILFFHNSHKLLPLWTRDQIGSPYYLYKFPSLTLVIYSTSGIYSFILIRTCWFLNYTTYTLSSITKIERKFILRPRENKTSLKSKELPNLSWKGIVPIHTTRYLASSPSSTYTP